MGGHFDWGYICGGAHFDLGAHFGGHILITQALYSASSPFAWPPYILANHEEMDAHHDQLAKGAQPETVRYLCICEYAVQHNGVT